MTLVKAGQTAPVVFILITLGVDALGIGLVIPIVPALVRELSGLGAGPAAHWTGALLATYAAAQFVAAPVLGGLSDRYGRRPVIILSLLGTAANYLLLWVAPSLVWLFIGRLLAGGTAANIAAANAYIADVTPPERRSTRFGMVGATFGAGFVFGPAFGGMLGAVDLRLPFLVAAVLSLANAAYGALVLPESLPPERRRRFSWRRANPIGSMHTLAKDKQVSRLAVTWCCMWVGMGALQSCFVLSMGLRFGWGPRECGLSLATVGVSQALTQALLVRPVIRWLGERQAAFVGFGFTGAAFLIFGLATAGWMIYVAAIVEALGAVAMPAMRALLSMQAGPSRQGEMQGGLSSVEGLTAVVSPVLAGAVFAWAATMGDAAWGGAPFLIGTLAYGVAAVMLGRARPAVALQS